MSRKRDTAIDTTTDSPPDRSAAARSVTAVSSATPASSA